MKIGFCNGDYYRIFSEPNERFSEKNLNLYTGQGKAKAIELHCINDGMINYLLNRENLDLSPFSFISLHTPHFPYKNNYSTNIFLSKLIALKEKFNIKNFVFHTDKDIDWDIFKNYKELPISIENMDNRKITGKTFNEIKTILDKYDFKLTLDLQHVFTNDSSMQLALLLQEEFRGRIAEYHISGFDPNLLHYPLFKTQQNIIIKSLKYTDLPIIVESTFDKLGEHETELEYILEKLNNS
jgi:hypothetical protein